MMEGRVNYTPLGFQPPGLEGAGFRAVFAHRDGKEESRYYAILGSDDSEDFCCEGVVEVMREARGRAEKYLKSLKKKE